MSSTKTPLLKPTNTSTTSKSDTLTRKSTTTAAEMKLKTGEMLPPDLTDKAALKKALEMNPPDTKSLNTSTRKITDMNPSDLTKQTAKKVSPTPTSAPPGIKRAPTTMDPPPPPAHRASPRPSLKTTIRSSPPTDATESECHCANPNPRKRKAPLSPELEEMVGSFEAEYKRTVFKEAMKAMAEGELGGGREKIEEIRGFFREAVGRLVEEMEWGV